MTHIISRDVIKDQARRAVDAGKPITSCPYEKGTQPAKRWIAAYLMREVEKEREEQSCANQAA